MPAAAPLHTSTPGVGVPLTATQVEQQIYEALTGGGLNASAAEGVIGNWEQESSFHYQDDSKYGLGLEQLTGSRATAEQAYAKAHGEQSLSVAAEVGYGLQEITSGTQGVTVAQLNAAGSPTAAADLYEKNVERASDPVLSNREKYATDAAGMFKSQPTIGHDIASTAKAVADAPAAAAGAVTGAVASGVSAIFSGWQSILIRVLEGLAAVTLIVLGLVAMSGSSPTTIVGNAAKAAAVA